jgi:large subunit ribosomal protein L18
MKPLQKKIFQRVRRKRRVRGGIAGTAACPRLSVFRSNKQIYAQIIDDAAGRTLCACSTRVRTLRDELKSGGNCAAAKKVGAALAAQALGKGIQRVVFDRGGYRYHGRIKALADAARESGLRL